MTFDLKKLFRDVFAPQPGEVVAVIVDFPHDEFTDNPEWQDRRAMAERWHRTIGELAVEAKIEVRPLIRYPATGSHNSDLPSTMVCDDKEIATDTLMSEATIIVCMSEFSASAPLALYARNNERLRAASMPRVAPAMEKTGLAADYALVADTCARLAPHFERAVGVEVEFSTGHRCYFDLSNHNQVLQDNGVLHLGVDDRIANLPSGEVCVCPNELEASQTAGEIPAHIGGETIVFNVKANKIVDVVGSGSEAARLRDDFKSEKAMRNIAEVAIGCNPSAAVTGNVLEDEKAGFHWAYGRSDHLRGMVGVSDFSSPDKVCHEDIVYAKESPIVCRSFDFVFEDGTRKNAIKEGELLI